MGGPIGTARVELIRIDGTTPQSYSGISAADGTFSILNVRPGTYRLAAARTGYLRREFGQRSGLGVGMTLNIEAGQQIRNLEIELRPAAAISGRVTDRQGDPLAATEVKALVPSYQDGRRILRTVQSTITNDLGEYRLFGPRRGHLLRLRNTGRSCRNCIGGESTSASADHQCVGPTGDIGFAAVYYPSTTDSRIASAIDVSSGGEYGGVNISIVSQKTYHIRGNVIGGMAPRDAVPEDPGLTTSVRSADASSGPFDFPAIAPGEYTLVARSGDLLGTASVNLRDNDIDRVTIGLSPTVPFRPGFHSMTGRVAGMTPTWKVSIST
jgi:hypothetical protein